MQRTLPAPGAANAKETLSLRSRIMIGATLAIAIAATGAMTYWLYGSMRQVFRLGLDERLIAMAAIGTIDFDPSALDRIHGPDSVGSEAYESVVRQLQHIRTLAPNVQYAYILRRTADPNTMEFVADADSLRPDEQIDLNADGVIDDEDALTYPGAPYDVSAFLEFRKAAFTRPFVDPAFTESQWGVFLSGTAPIRDANSSRPVEYVLGLDLNVTQYEILLRRVFYPFLGFAVFLLAIICLEAFSLGKLWGRQVRQLAEIDRQKDELLSIVSHQLGGPITALRWGLEALADDADDRLKKDIAVLLGTVVGLADLTNILLDLSRIELGRLSSDKRPTDLGAFFEQILTVILPLAAQSGVTVTSRVPKDLPTVSIDPRLTRMTLENLLNNAVKYTPAGGTVSLIVEITGDRLTCIVRDTGCGIPKADQQRLFTKLFRASNVRDKIKGNGFGLYIAKGAIEQQGGAIHCESEVSKGTTFTVELPLGEAASSVVS